MIGGHGHFNPSRQFIVPSLMAPAERFSTARLDASRLQPDDFSIVHRMHQDHEVMKTLGGIRSEGKTRVYLRTNLEHWDRYGYGLWILRERRDQRFVGRSAIRHVELDGKDEIEVGYALMRQYWGRGLATEVAREMIKLAFSSLRITDLVAFTLRENVASRRVMEKAGGIYERDIVHADQPHVLYRFRPSSPVL
jgi:RimJ/RimL family protein N-acetyltransferase